MSAEENTPLLANANDSSDNEAALGKKRSPHRQKYLYLLLLLVMLAASGSINGVLLKIVYNKYGQNYAYFVDQGNNLFYLIQAGTVVLYKLKFTKAITAEQRAFPQRKFIYMALADGFGTFLTAMGAVHTPGQYQTVINQTLIPCTMILAFFLLKTRYSSFEMIGAAITLGGACLGVIPGMISSNGAGVVWYSVLVYFLSNIPMAFSAVYKELGFRNAKLDCFYLTYMVSLYQFVVSIAFAPLQAVPGLGGISLKDIPDAFWGGMKCFAGADVSDPTASCHLAGLWLIIYCLNNFIYNVLGLMLTSAGADDGFGAVLCTIGYALKVPITNALFTWKLIMGDDVERFTTYTIAGLVVVMVGFVVYMIAARMQLMKRSEEREVAASLHIQDAEFEGGESSSPWGFHERIVGIVSTSTVPISTLRASKDAPSVNYGSLPSEAMGRQCAVNQKRDAHFGDDYVNSV